MSWSMLLSRWESAITCLVAQLSCVGPFMGIETTVNDHVQPDWIRQPCDADQVLLKGK